MWMSLCESLILLPRRIAGLDFCDNRECWYERIRVAMVAPCWQQQIQSTLFLAWPDLARTWFLGHRSLVLFLVSALLPFSSAANGWLSIGPTSYSRRGLYSKVNDEVWTADLHDKAALSSVWVVTELAYYLEIRVEPASSHHIFPTRFEEQI